MVLLACDQGGYDLKMHLKKYLQSLDQECEDIGVEEGQIVDYPDVAHKAASHIKSGKYQFGVVICGTGIGISIAANRHEGVRCALLSDVFSAKMAKEHNNANLIAFGGRVTTGYVAEELLKTFMDAQFQGGRHQKRVDKIDEDSSLLHAWL